LAADPAAAEDRHQRAAADRRVVLTPAPDGMAELWALLPADGAATIQAALDRLARRPRPAGDHRRIDARRADALVQLAAAAPEDGTVHAVGRGRYTPSAALADLVRTRDITCRFPGCRHPARRWDLDHITPYPAGPTTAANLASLCRHHHRLKHQTRWQVHQQDPAILTWTSPTGHQYLTHPPPVTDPAPATGPPAAAGPPPTAHRR